MRHLYVWALGLVLVGCGTPGTEIINGGQSRLELAKVCCATLADAPVAPLPIDRTKVRIDERKPVYEFDGSKSFFAMYRLPAFRSPYTIILSSLPGGTEKDTAVFWPRVAFFDENFNPTRKFDESVLRTRGDRLESLMVVDPANEQDRYMVVYASNQTVPVDNSEPVAASSKGTGLLNWFGAGDATTSVRPSPVGTIELQALGVQRDQ